MGSSRFQLQTSAPGILERLNILNGKKKLVSLIILINLVIIGAYLIRAGRRSSLFVVTSVTNHNNNDLDIDEYGNSRLFRHILNENLGSSANSLSIKDQRLQNLSNERGLFQTSTANIKKAVHILVKPNVVADMMGRGLKTFLPEDDWDDFEEEEYEEEDEEEEEIVTDVEEGSHFYNKAFPGHQIPKSLLKWTPSKGFIKYFQPVDKDGKAYVFSAYYEPAYPDVVVATAAAAADAINEGYVDYTTVRVLITRHRDMKVIYYCHFYNEDGLRTFTKKGRLRSLKGSRKMLYVPSYIQCPMPTRKGDSTPYYVSLTLEPDDDKPTNQVRIHYPGSRLRDFTVCFSPLHSNYNFTGQLIEAFEFNRLLGADHFFVYNFSVSSQTDAILRYYESEGLVTIIQWPLPNLEMWYYGQILAVNDCIYRNKGVSKYVVIADTDELIIPHQHSTWNKMISDIVETRGFLEDEDNHSKKVRKLIKSQSLNIHPLSPFGGFSFRCSFYADKRLEPEELFVLKKYEFSLKQKRLLVQFPSRRMLSLKRMDNVYGHKVRSKTIVRPEFVDVGSIHIVPKLKPGYQMAFVNPEAALLHHYRVHREIRFYNTLDATALKFKDSYLERLKIALLKFPRIFPAVARMADDL